MQFRTTELLLLGAMALPPASTQPINLPAPSGAPGRGRGSSGTERRSPTEEAGDANI